ncbi:hypothetical protein [Colwellia sp. PAMC 21821]|uniref:hypothetical protein n=1 Tax=Colwellia sp. PAMC 21821 TaxID=1816219 RepID=UPI0009BE3630|nr:hypothetical protein [Colwellia sp. PAMC 21821]ARD43058.1 hypothetical protein A3Q33_01160 [Colwellia sp. PAMC 21821]
MDSQTVLQQKTPVPAKKRKWGFLFLLVIVVTIIGYFSYTKSQNTDVNHDYYRLLYETSKKFNDNLIKLERLIESKESGTSIRSILPSYKLTGDSVKEDKDTFKYYIQGDEIHIKKSNEDKTPFVLYAKLSIKDLLPKVSKGFSQLIFSDSNARVIHSSGGEKNISFSDLTSISQEIRKQNKPISFSTKTNTKQEELEEELPSYSSHVDMNLSYGEFRVYIFPFKLIKSLTIKTEVEGKELKDVEFFSLYIVALLPKYELKMHGTGQWNISLLVVLLVSLLTILAMLRLYLLPLNHPITRFYRYFVCSCCYLFFFVIVAMLLAYLQMLSLQEYKDSEAIKFTTAISSDLNNDLNESFTRLKKYQKFYSEILKDVVDNNENTPLNEVLPLTLSEIESTKLSLLNITTAITQDKEYQLFPDDNIENALDIENSLDIEAQNTLVDAYLSKQIKTPTLGFLSEYLKVNVIENKEVEEVETYLDIDWNNGNSNLGKENILPNNILSIFALDGLGNSWLPGINYNEDNSLPQTLNLSYRDYFKKVRDNNAWELKFSSTIFQNVYIQRLQNIANGSRGTTISMPLFDENNRFASHDKAKSYILGADILLPSVEMREPAGMDFTYMIVNRKSGEILFHSNESRTMVENLFYAGNDQSILAQWIKAGLEGQDNIVDKNKAIKGNYHGQMGRFFVRANVVDSWATVVFYPDDTLNAFMTSQFIYLLLSLIFFLSLIFLMFFISKRITLYLSPNTENYFFSKSDTRVFLFGSSLFCTITFSIYIILLTLSPNLNDFFTSTVFDWPFIHLSALILFSLFIYHLYQLWTVKVAKSKTIKLTMFSYHGAFTQLVLLATIMAFVQINYLNTTAKVSFGFLQEHYENQYCNETNLKKLEFNNIGIRLFPNSIMLHNFKSIDILQSHNNWLEELTACEGYSTVVHPEDFPYLSTLVGTNYFWEWVGNIFTGQKNTELSNKNTKLNPANFQIFGFVLLIILTLIAWIVFTKKVLWTRLYCSVELLEHISQLTSEIQKIKPDTVNEKLRINCGSSKINSVGLDYLIGRQTIKNQIIGLPPETKDNDDEQTNELIKYFPLLFSESAVLQDFLQENKKLPNVKLNIRESENLLDVEIGDIEICLDEPKCRHSLLNLIMELKSLTLLGKFNCFTIYASFHSLQRVAMKNLLALDNDFLLKHAEYLSWAECLMDFKIKLPDKFNIDFDKNFLNLEVANFPELRTMFICNDPSEQNKEKLCDNPPPSLSEKSKEWSTIHYILMHAEPIYRFKWELCSSAEKLALYNLANQRRLNPQNYQMIEHLALNGLIKVEKDHLTIINKSFAQFILNAESSETMSHLEIQAEEGVWKTYRVPIALLVILIIGAVALTSGQSIAIIGASMLGILTTVASVTNSANLLKSQIK